LAAFGVSLDYLLDSLSQSLTHRSVLSEDVLILLSCLVKMGLSLWRSSVIPPTAPLERPPPLRREASFHVPLIKGDTGGLT